MAKRCVWCANPNADENAVTDPEKDLCRSHLAEFEGTTEYGLDAQDAGYAYDTGRMYG